MKILTITGTRPELIRLAVILRKLDELSNNILVYTNQNYDPNLSTIFFSELKIKTPDYIFEPVKVSGEFLGEAFKAFDSILEKEKPSKVLVLGDTNSGLLAIQAAKRNIPVYHMEAGNRCYDNEVPEETNRRIIDACSMFNLPYTETSKQNLINEGYHKNQVYKIGNPIKEVLFEYMPKIEESHILDKLGLTKENVIKPFALLSFHRTENVDNRRIAENIKDAINYIADIIPVVFPIHPRTKDQFIKHKLEFSEKVILTDPLGFFDFVKLEKYAEVILTDSGTVPEETSIFKKACIVLRKTIERQELIENGSLILAGIKTDDIIRAFNSIRICKQDWQVLDDYNKDNVSDTVIRLLLGQTISLSRKEEKTI